jgi:hypothetical protein
LNIPYLIEKKIISPYNPAGIIIEIESDMEQPIDPVLACRSITGNRGDYHEDYYSHTLYW